jgi:hypothetical protein
VPLTSLGLAAFGGVMAVGDGGYSVHDPNAEFGRVFVVRVLAVLGERLSFRARLPFRAA